MSDIYSYDVCTAQCDAGTGTNALFQQLYRKPPKLLVLGGGCSEVSEATAQVSHLWNLVQVCGARRKHILRPFIYGAYYGIVLSVRPSVCLSIRINKAKMEGIEATVPMNILPVAHVTE